MKIVISSGHGKYISGAVGPSPWGIHEHTEAVKVVNEVAAVLRSMDVDVITYEDTVSKSQNENLDRIVAFHNSQGAHDLDVSIHFNSTDPQPIWSRWAARCSMGPRRARPWPTERWTKYALLLD